MTGREKLMMAVCAAMGLTSATAAMGQVSYDTAGDIYSQNFDSLQATGANNTQVTWSDNLTLSGWYAALGTTSAPATIYRINDGGSNTGGVTSFGTSGDTDRALGSIGSGSTGPTGGPIGVYYGMQIVNNTGGTLPGFTLSYTGEEWRATGTTSLNTTVQNTLSFSYSTTASTIYDTSGYNAVTGLDFKAPAAGSPPGYTATDAAVNGNSATFQTQVSQTVTIAGGWAPGASLWVRWLDINDAGNDQGLAIDNLSFSAVAHIPQHNGTVLLANGSKTASQIDLGRVVVGSSTNTATVNLSSTGGSTTYTDLSTDGSVVTPATGSTPSSGTTPVTVKIAGTAITTASIGQDVNTNAVIQNSGEDDDSNTTVPLKAHVVTNRFVDNYDPSQAAGGSTVPVDFGKMLVGSSKTVTGVMLTTVNTNTYDYSDASLTTVQLPAGSVTGFAGGATSGFATVTMAAGANGDVTFDDGGDMDTRDVTLTVVQSGLVRSGATGGERSPGYLSIPIVQLDTAVGASGDARIYVAGDFYAPANVTATATAVPQGGAGTVSLVNTQSEDGAAGKRLGADILGTTFNQSGWAVSGLPASIGGSRGQFTISGTVTPSVTPTVTGTLTLDTAGKLNGTYGATLTLSLQNDQTQGVYGVAPNDLPTTTVDVQGTVSDKPAVQNGTYSLNGGTLSAPATNLTGSFTQSGGASTFTSIVGGGSVTVSGGLLSFSPGATTNVVRSLAVSGSGKVDLTSAKVVIDYTGSTPAGAVRGGLLLGSAGNWTGATGLTSSDAAAHADQSYAIGYGEASLILGLTGAATTSWNGATVDATSLLLKETYYGDATLDGQVNADDLSRLDLGLAKYANSTIPAGGAVWTDGDFNYDGVIDVSDYFLADTSFAQHGGVLSPGLLSEREAQFGEAYVTTLLASVPEPTSLGLVGVIGAGLIGRRRRSAK